MKGHVGMCLGISCSVVDQSVGVPCRGSAVFQDQRGEIKNLSNVSFFIQDADQRFRNELSGMV